MTVPIQPTFDLAKPRLFISYAKEDSSKVHELNDLLVAEGFAPWLDAYELVAGQDWEAEIRKAMKAAKLVLLILSKNSVNKAGYVQKELREALDIADTFPEGRVYIIPIRLDDCSVPARVSRWQWIDVFSPVDYPRLIRSLEFHVERKRPLKKAKPDGALSALAADREFCRACMSIGRFIYARIPGGFIVSDGRMLMLRKQIGLILGKLQNRRFISTEMKPETLQNVIPRHALWREQTITSEKVVSRGAVLLTSLNGRKLGIAEHYLRIVRGRFPYSRLHIASGPMPCIVVGDTASGKVEAVVMPLIIPEAANG